LNDWFGSLVSKGRILYIFTPWAADDLSAYLKKHGQGYAYKKWKHGKPGDPYFSIFPERWPREVLIARRREMGAIHYSRAYLCEALSEGIISVMPEHLRKYNTALLTEEKLQTAIAVISVDPAKGEEAQKGKPDYFGVTIGLLVLYEEDHNPPFELFIVDCYQVERLSLGRQAIMIHDLVREWEASAVLVEAKGMQSLHSYLEIEQRRDLTTPPFEIIPITFGNISKGTRIEQAAPLLNPPEGDLPYVYFHPDAVTATPQPGVVEVDGINYEINRELREQLLSFPTTHDDAMDSCTQLLNWVRMNYADTDTGWEDVDESGGASSLGVISL
jgi:hypothetical protein